MWENVSYIVETLNQKEYKFKAFNAGGSKLPQK